MQTQSHKLTLALIVLLALAWRMLLWAQPPHLPANDEGEYVQVARDLVAGRGWILYTSWPWLRAPLYPLFLAGSLWLAGGDLHMAALPNLALSVGVVGVTYGLTRALAPSGRHAAALLAAAIAAALQTYATFASLYMSETLFSLLFGLGLLALARWQTSGGLGRAFLAGALVGLACLTRSAALAFLPVAGLWMAWITFRRIGPHLGIVRSPLALALGAAIVIAPWTLHTCQAYGRCILIETGGAYNMWAFYEPREARDVIDQILGAIPNPAERADIAIQHGLARLREDPTIIARKIPAEWNRLWVVKPIEDRFLLANNYSDPPPALFLSGLLLDDMLYLVVLCAAPFGFALVHRNAFGLLLSLWVAVFVLATFVTHTEGRYRHFLFVALIPLAAVALAAVARRELPPRALALATGAALTLALLPCLLYYPWAWAGSGALRSVYRAIGDRLAGFERNDAAASAYQAALQVDSTADGWIALGDLQRRTGDVGAAIYAYKQAHAMRPSYVGASAAWGDLLRELGRADEARAAFRGRYLDQQELVNWSFLMRPPLAAATVEVGNGLDFGYIGGVYQAERQQGMSARWTDGRGLLHLQVAGKPGPALLTLRVAAPRPDGVAVPLRVCTSGTCADVSLGVGWHVVHLLLPSVDAAPIELRSPTFHAADGRDLGVLLNWATLEPTVSGQRVVEVGR